MDIIKTILALLGLTTPTADTAIKSIQKSVVTLEKVAEANGRKVTKSAAAAHREIIAHRRRLSKHEAAERAAQEEAARARRVAAKLNDLVA